MADLLTHVLVAYVLFTVCTWWVDGPTEHWRPLVMAGAAIPDLTRIGLVVDTDMVERVLGAPFSYSPISSVGGVVVVAAGITACFTSYRRRVFGLLVAGGMSALVLDGMRMYADGRANFWLYPLWWRPPTPNLYVTSDVRVPVLALGASAVVFLVDRYVVSRRG